MSDTPPTPPPPPDESVVDQAADVIAKALADAGLLRDDTDEKD